MKRGWIGSTVLLVTLGASAIGLAAWKQSSRREAAAAAGHQPEPTEAITVAVAEEQEYQRTTTSIGTVLALRSIALRNEVAGTVSEVELEPGAVVDQGAVLIQLDVSVERAELRALEAQAALAGTLLGRLQRASENRGSSQADVDRASAQRDVALAEVARTQALIDKKTIRAPFRARVGLADVHPGQYLVEGTELTTLQGVDDAVHVDFSVGQTVAAGLSVGDRVLVSAIDDPAPLDAAIVAIDARVDPATRNALVRARIEGAAHAPAPGASVRVRVPVGPPIAAVAVPVSALRRGPGGDHVFAVAADEQGQLRAHERPVQSGMVLGDLILIHAGLEAGEQVAASGSFKLREGVLVAVDPAADAAPGGDPGAALGDPH